jgi:EF hand domain-containing protein
MVDVREWVDGARTVRVHGLDAKGASLATAQFELETMLWNGLQAAGVALVDWRGRHADTFVDDANRLFGRFSRLIGKVRAAKRVVHAWPARPGRPTLEEENASPPQVDVPPTPGTSAADPATLDAFRLWCEDVALRLPALTGCVDLDDLTAEVTAPPIGAIFDEVLDPTPWPRSPAGPLLAADPMPVTTPSDPARHIEVPDVSGRTTATVDLASELGAWTAAVAMAFRTGDSHLIDLLADHPDLADELLAGLADPVPGGESSLVMVLAYFDALDRDGDGTLSVEELSIAAHDTGVPDYVREAAAYLRDNLQLRWLVDTVNNDMEYASDIAGSAQDEKISIDDVTTFLAFNDQLEVVEQHFDAFDIAAHPDNPADGQISRNDLEALAEGEGEGPLAGAAQWLLDHAGALTRLEHYEDAKPGFLGPVGAPQAITAASLLLLTVDQQVYAGRPNASGSFVDRRFETLMSRGFGETASPDGMRSVFGTALTTSDQRGALMDRVIAEVAADGTIHNTGLHMAFADGAAANMPVIDDNINAATSHQSGAVPEGVRQEYLDTHDFLREVSRDPAAAERLREGLYDWGMSATDTAAGSEPERSGRLSDVGRVMTVLDYAQENALTGDAVDALREAMAEAREGGGPRASMGSVTDYGLGHIPVLGSVNNIADGMGLSSGDATDWLLGELESNTEDPFDSLSAARQATAIRETEGRVAAAIWLVNDHYGTDATLRAAAQGQPFVDERGALKTDMTAGDAQALREWAVAMTEQGQPLRDDYESIKGGEGDVEESPKWGDLEIRL